MRSPKTKLTVLLLAFSAIGCGGGGGGPDLREVRPHNPNPFNGHWYSTTQVTEDSCGIAKDFNSFKPNLHISMSGDDFEIDVRESGGISYDTEMVTATTLGGWGSVRVRCSGRGNQTVRQRIDVELVEENRAQIDISMSFTCPNRNECKVSASGYLDYQREL